MKHEVRLAESLAGGGARRALRRLEADVEEIDRQAEQLKVPRKLRARREAS